VLCALKRAEYKQKYAAELQQHDAALQYLKAHLNGRTIIPEKAWKAEREQLYKDRFDLTERYFNLKDDVKNAEALRRGAQRVMDGVEHEPEYQHTRTHEWYL